MLGGSQLREGGRGAEAMEHTGVENGIDAAVDASQRPRDLVGKVNDVQHGAVSVQQSVSVVQGACYVEGHEAHCEHHQHYHD